MIALIVGAFVAVLVAVAVIVVIVSSR